MDPKNTSVVELGEILAGRHPGRQYPHEISIADLTGIAAQDIAIAAAVLARTQRT